METITTEYLKRELPAVEEDDPRVIAYYWEAFFVADGYDDEDDLPEWASLDTGHITVDDHLAGNFPSHVFARARYYPVTQMTDTEVSEAQASGNFEPGFDPRIKTTN